MFHINLENYNTPYQQYIKKRFLDTLPDNDSTPENYGAITNFEWVLGAPESHGTEDLMMKYALENPDCTIDDLLNYYDEVTPPITEIFDDEEE